MADTEKTEKKDTSAIQNAIRVLEQEIQALKNKVNTLDKILQQIGNCKKEWQTQRYTYRYNPNLSSLSISNKFEGNYEKTSKKKLSEAYSKMEENYKKADELSQGLSSQISKLKGIIASKNQELSNKNAELRGYM